MASEVPDDVAAPILPAAMVEHIVSFLAEAVLIPSPKALPPPLLATLALVSTSWRDAVGTIRERQLQRSLDIAWSSGSDVEQAQSRRQIQERAHVLVDLRVSVAIDDGSRMRMVGLSGSTWSGVDWSTLLEPCSRLERLDLSALPFDPDRLVPLLSAASQRCPCLKALILPACADKLTQAADSFFAALYHGLETWSRAGGGLLQLTLPHRPALSEEEEEDRDVEFFTTVARCCQRMQFLDGWKATCAERSGRHLDRWHINLQTWTHFCQHFADLREFNWIVVPFTADFVRKFALFPKKQLTTMRIEIDGDAYHRTGWRDSPSTQDMISMIRAVPELEKLSIEVLLTPSLNHASRTVSWLCDGFLNAVAEICPKLQSFSLAGFLPWHEVTENGFLKLASLPELTVLSSRIPQPCSCETIQGFLHNIASLPARESQAYMEFRNVPGGILPLIQDALECVLRAPSGQFEGKRFVLNVASLRGTMLERSWHRQIKDEIERACLPLQWVIVARKSSINAVMVTEFILYSSLASLSRFQAVFARNVNSEWIYQACSS